MKSALISGITGQDGSYLAEYLLDRNYTVYGLLPHRNLPNFTNIGPFRHRLRLLDGDMQDGTSLSRVVKDVQPDEIYNLAAQSFVAKSWDLPELTNDVNYMGVIRLLSAIHQHSPHSRFYQASTSEIFGLAEAPQAEWLRLHPGSPYGVAKAAAHMAVTNYRESHGLFACSGILFNHESERRGEHFVTQKIAKAAVKIARGEQEAVYLGNLSPKRDWGYAPDYVACMWKMLQQDEPDDYCVGTGHSITVAEFVEKCFARAGVAGPWQDSVRISDDLVRPVDIPELRADIRKAKTKLNWSPTVDIDGLVDRMVTRWEQNT